MITFLPSPDYKECAKILDYKRLGKNRIEAKWVVQVLFGESKWINHALIRLWEPYRASLIHYCIEICEEWIRRGYNDNQLNYFLDRRETYYVVPNWMTEERLFSSHRTKLITKDPIYYSRFNWEEVPDPNVGYFWP